MSRFTLSRATPVVPMVFREMDEMQNRLRRYFNDVAGLEPLGESLGWMPLMEITEHPDALVLTAELPGVSKEHVDVSYADDVLTIRGEKKDEKQGNGDTRFHLVERTYGAFERSFTLPRTVDGTKITAEFRNGVLIVRLPKTSVAQTRARKIEVADKG